MNLTIIRHGQPEHNKAFDPPLSALGQQQAEAVCAVLAEEQFDVVISSSALRAQQTAAPLMDNLRQKLILFDELLEIDYGDPIYVRMEEARQQKGEAWALWRKRLGSKVDEPEVVAPFVNQIRTTMSQLAETYHKQNVLAFAHAGVINALAGWATHSPFLYIVAPEYCSISRFSIRPGSARMASVNEKAHLKNISP